MSSAEEERRRELRGLVVSLQAGPIGPSDERYFDFRTAPGQPRGADPIEDLRATISLTEAGTTCQLFSGQAGTGKTTELRRLAAELSAAGFHVVFVPAGEVLPLHQPLEILSLLLGVATAIADAVEHLSPEGSASRAIVSRLSALVTSTRVGLTTDLGADTGKPSPAAEMARWKAELSRDLSFKARLRQTLEGRLHASLAEIATIMADARAFFASRRNGRSPVLIVDDIEKISDLGSHQIEVQASLEQVFSQLYHHLRIPGWHSVWTVPPSLRLRDATLALKYDSSLLLPMIRLWHADPTRSRDEEGFLAARQCLRKRGDIGSLFSDEEVLDELILACSGHLRDLLRLVLEAVREVWKQNDPTAPLRPESARRLVGDYESNAQKGVYRADLPWLEEVASNRNLRLVEPDQLARAARLFDTGVIVAYQNGDSWLDVSRPVQGLLDSSEPARTSGAPAPATGVFRILSAGFSNLRPFDRIDIASSLGSPEAGQWIVFIGENGVGKSTLLRGLAFALADGSAAAGALGKSPAPYRGAQDAPARIEVQTLERAFSATIRLDSEARRESLSREPKNGGHRPFLVAYGCQRGSALGGPNREVSFAPEMDIVTLFDETRGLAHAETWLTKLEVAAQKDSTPRSRALLAAVIELLKEILHVDEITVDGDAVWVDSVDTDRARLAALSDGYLTTAGWMVDMIARWIDRARRLGWEVLPGFNLTMAGAVLVDELDLHLHPRWQVRVIDDLRRLFPRMTFVVTTHNPLTLLGAREGEVIVLRRAEADVESDVSAAPVLPRRIRRVEVHQQDIPPGLTIDQVLTGAWFGLASTLDKNTLALLEKHRSMLREGVSRDAPERASLESELRRRLGGFADTSLERLAQGVAATLLPERASDLGPERRERLRKHLLEAVAAETAGKASPARP